MAEPITVAAVGDLMLRRRPSPDLPLDDLRAADMRVANLEGPITDRGTPADKVITMRMPPGAGAWVRDLGFDAVSLANNHALDYGAEGLVDTLAALEQAAVAHAGAGMTAGEALRPSMTEIAGVTVATVSLAATVPPGFAAGAERPGVAPLRVQVSFEADGSINEEQPGTPPWVHTEVVRSDLEPALEAVRRAREEADIVLVQLHWGVPPEWNSPFQGDLAEYQRPLAHAVIDAGASVILGHHPHALHGIERYRDALIFYSLGNFIFHTREELKTFRSERPAPPFRPRYSERNLQSLAATLFIDRSSSDLRLARAELTPFRLDGGAEPRAVTGAGAERIFRVVAESDATSGVDIRTDVDRVAIEID